ncbi:MAG: hypothetical protein LC799_06485, partial [Actinobacteria bacterium]|nr:hypothetical protein [Actinomycetota bacterium]
MIGPIAQQAGWLDHAGVMPEPTGAEVRATAADAARQARAVLAALADPDDELTATAAMRNLIEGAAVALETVAGQPLVIPALRGRGHRWPRVPRPAAVQVRPCGKDRAPPFSSPACTPPQEGP